MKKLMLLVLLNYAVTTYAQIDVNDDYFVDNYNPVFIKENKIRQINVRYSINDGNGGTAVMDFNRQGVMMSRRYFNYLGIKTSDYVYTYNDSGTCIKIENEDYDIHKKYEEFIFRHYESGKLSTDSSSIYFFYTKYFYDAIGRKIQDSRVMKNELYVYSRTLTLYCYNEKNQLSRKIRVEIGSQAFSQATIQTSEYRYDTAGNPVSVKKPGVAEYSLTYFPNSKLLKTIKTISLDDLDLNILDEYSYAFWE